MFNKDFYPTPEAVILQMIEGYDIQGKTVLEPSAGKGNIVDVLLSHGANVIACENNKDLQKILTTKCKVIADDFLTVQAADISHVDFIIMNPPFSADEDHILHAWNIAPAGCKIITLCNLETVNLYYKHGTKKQQQIESLLKNYGRYENLGNCFSTAERKTDVEISLIHLQKPADNYESEFNGFFLDEEPEEQGSGIMSYNVVRDLVNRYIAAVKLYDEQLELGLKMNALTGEFFGEYHSSKFAFTMKADEKNVSRSDFKKELQKGGWKHIFSKLNMDKYTTKGLEADINEFVEKQTNIPFTMKNIYAMLEIVIGTTGQRMDKALLEVFDKLTEHYSENRYHVEGWKTNSHYLINKKFIMPSVVSKGWSGQMEVNYNGWAQPINDIIKALCYISGSNYDTLTYPTLQDFVRHLTPDFGRWYSWGFFEIKGYKKGTMHFEFQNEDVWAQFNQRIAKLKGYPLYEGVKTKKTEQGEKETAKRYRPEVLATIKLKTI